MNEKEKEAVATMKHWIEYEKENKDKINKVDELIQMQETILNLIEKQQKEIEEYKTLFKRQKELEQEKETLKKQGWL